jgi:hypothetical protein
MTEPTTTVPRWAKNIDDYGRRRWHKEKPHRNRRQNYVGNIIWNLIWLFIVNKVPDWHLSFINDHYLAVLWALNMSIVVQIGGNILMFLLDFRLIRNLCRIIMEAAGFLVLIILYYIYPFDFSNTHGWAFMDQLLPWLMIIGMVVTALTILASLWKLIFWRE